MKRTRDHCTRCTPLPLRKSRHPEAEEDEPMRRQNCPPLSPYAYFIGLLGALTLVVAGASLPLAAEVRQLLPYAALIIALVLHVMPQR